MKGEKILDNTFTGNGSVLSSEERETIINYNNADKTANCYSLNLTMRRRALELAEEYPDDIHIIMLKDDAVEFTFPKSWVKIRPPRKLTDEQREELVRRGRELYEKQQAKKAAEMAEN